ncbi:cytochrome P450, family 722, subfamily A, polypeptide 1 [Actinidia rufa]|uniref:Cytochrome P450, family 722, subfamily A, polypeptide 1 n=1 Tax=Actinidia rufa TaxID=165716 RepID=A0A7J0GHZ0_9ERIC|nr:cytochrome P450, family 722, subfamily A, polypeptide 1 [Actinidia rufa]
MEDDHISCGDESQSLSDEQIKDNILTMIIAGQDTTASAITWMVKYLDENQEVLEILKAEQFSLAEKSSPNSFLSLEDLNDMSYSSKVSPKLRLRYALQTRYKIKKGWNINIDARSIHLDPTVYNDPDKFIPSRFDDESKPYSFLGFGQGGRTCLGMNLARAMMLVFLHRLVTTYKWKVIDSDSSIEQWALFARLKSGCPVHVARIRDDVVRS